MVHQTLGCKSEAQHLHVIVIRVLDELLCITLLPGALQDGCPMVERHGKDHQQIVVVQQWRVVLSSGM